ncbi:hypothetical protein BOTNAR_1481g00020 [Botryotinia narcissicola]|uniref:Uncharacterized protein n=1 Tax=Botryotinia narcissicola TaxID=278944 RepID=A0A4Z1H380_9HELO|nr:hypothetical protein BOTNAR_1481g00020 [Botryotinia narcissicola]
MESPEYLKSPLLGTGSESGDSTLFPSQEYERQKKPRAKVSWYTYIVLSATIILAWTSGLLLYNHYTTTSPYALTHRGECGWSVADAKANGCVFDIMMSSWLTKPCYDKELSDRYLAVNNFTFWEHSKGTGQLSRKDMQKGEFDIIFTHATYHTQHCLFLWEKQIKAANSRRPVLDSITRSQHHIEHCIRILTAHTAENYTSAQKALFKTGTPIHVKPQNQICWEG